MSARTGDHKKLGLSRGTEDKFMEVLQEMSRICGVADEPERTRYPYHETGYRSKASSDVLISGLPPPFSSPSPPPPGAANSLSPPSHSHSVYTSLPLSSAGEPKKPAKRRYQRKKNQNDASNSETSDTNGFHKRHRQSSGTADLKRVLSPLGGSLMDPSGHDIYASSIHTPRSDPTPEESGSVCDINAVLQENPFSLSGKGSDCGIGIGSGLEAGGPPPSIYPTPSPPQTPPSLREQRRKYQQHLNISLIKSDWLGNSRDHERRMEIEAMCLDLLKRYQQALSVHPPINPAACLGGGLKNDPLLVATRLLTHSLARLRLFLSNLDCMHWLSWQDRNSLYKANICVIAILKASVGLDLGSMPVAYPLPYGEYLAETEALQLLTAHDLYNDLRDTIASVQALDIREFPVMLMVILAAYFRYPYEKQLVETTGPGSSSERIAKMQAYYNNKLQTYLSLRYGANLATNMLHNIHVTIDKVKIFSDKLKIFLGEVTKVGLQNQYEPVCENLGLMAYLLQCEPLIEF